MFDLRHDGRNLVNFLFLDLHF
ncbi:hypothetical protein GQF03_02610 [Sneathiella chungangensis]|uniref:Uncharacterized protein n=1 Tax=Sneathiella chungangensis TaxID=1418234 RepID=A0A845MDT5_9PROT|nr:hypothetical protein [Sneathiella chungangensis]